MDAADNVVSDVRNPKKGGHDGYLIFCPGCEGAHIYDDRWTFNGDYKAPTFKPSYLATGMVRCHSFVTDGKIQFLGDCTHDLKGQTVALEPLDPNYVIHDGRENE